MKLVSEKKIVTKSAEETGALGQQLGEALLLGRKLHDAASQETSLEKNGLGKGSDACQVICLYGDLGAGKTAFIAGLARGLGVTDYVTSPTFTIVNEYDGKVPLFHFDVYRVYDPDELYEIGFEEYFSRGGVVCIEWADLIPSMLPTRRIEVEIRKCADSTSEDLREITIRRSPTARNQR